MLIIPSSKSNTIREDLDHVTPWAVRCNLSLNQRRHSDGASSKPGKRRRATFIIFVMASIDQINQRKTRKLLICRPCEWWEREEILEGVPKVQNMIIPWWS